jgi:ABC-2 type transport system permease protein
VTLFDPLTYGVEGVRYGLTGISQVNPITCVLVLAGFASLTTLLGAYLFRKIEV